MFPRYSDRLYPGYAAYPSGHSTQVHAVAYLYARMFPALEPRLLAAAQRVAGNREVAGLHFATDTQAGRDMARQIIDLIWGREEFQAMIANARIEWPEH
jgi:acid phosphatase (class A)